MKEAEQVFIRMAKINNTRVPDDLDQMLEEIRVGELQLILMYC